MKLKLLLHSFTRLTEIGGQNDSHALPIPRKQSLKLPKPQISTLFFWGGEWPGLLLVGGGWLWC